MQRIFLPDFLKGVAVVLMIQVHITELFATPEVYDSLTGRISLFLGGVPAAPLFMAVMGYFVVRGGNSSLQLIVRGMWLIGYGLLLNIGLNAHLLIKILNGTYVLDPWKYVFGVDILFLAGLSLMVMAAFIQLKNKGLVFLAAALLVVVATRYVSQLATGSGWAAYLKALVGSYADWSYFPLFPWLAYPLTGAAFYTLSQHSWIQKKKYYFMAASMLIFLLLFSEGFSVSTTLAAYYHHGLVFYLWALAFLIVLFFALQWVSPMMQDAWIGKYLGYLGKHVTKVYVIQWLIIGNVATAIYRSLSLWAGVASFVAVLAITSGLVYLIINNQNRRAEKEKYRVF